MVSSMGRKKIVYVPLDERPCNYNFPMFLYQESQIDIVNVPINYMGKNKISADFSKLKDFLLKETIDADGLVISIDTLCYGGIVPSRIHHLDLDTLKDRLYLLTEIKSRNPHLMIYAFSLIMRCPQYSLSVEEPDYYDICGREIFRKGFLSHKKKLGIINDIEEEELNNIIIKEEYLNDYLNRRKINIQINLETLELVKNKVIDFMIFPQDDAAEYGYTALDQELVREKIYNYRLNLKALMYPGADEVGLVLLSRIQNYFTNNKFKVFIKYPSITSAQIIPCLEDRYLDTTIKYQIIASGGIVVDSISDCDIILISSIGATGMISGPNQSKPRGVSVYANYVETFEFIKYYINAKPIMIADLTYLNGGNLELFEQIIESNLTLKLAGYAGWNTSSNTLGTVISQGFNYLINHDTISHKEFLLARYIEDIGYCSIVRGEVSKILDNFGVNYFDVSKKITQIETLVTEKLQQFINQYLSDYSIKLEKVTLPWNRMFEVELNVKIS